MHKINSLRWFWAWNKGYHIYRYACFIPLAMPRNWQWTFQLYAAISQQHLHMEYIFQLIRYSRACGSYQDFLDRGLLLTRKLLDQWFLLGKLKSSLRKSYGRHHDLVDCCGIYASTMNTDIFHFLVLYSFTTYHTVCN